MAYAAIEIRDAIRGAGPKPTMPFHKRLYEAFSSSDVSLHELARYCLVRDEEMSACIGGEDTDPPVSLLARSARKLGVPEEEFMAYA